MAKTTKTIKQVLTVVAKPGESLPQAIARSVLDPTALAGSTLSRINWSVDNIEVTALVGELQTHARDATAGRLDRPEAMLIAQAHTLDSLFHSLINRSRANTEAGYTPAAETYMRLALKAQSQCRSTVETLAEIKNPSHVAFVRQANIANGPQQVNNGPRAEETENQQNKLLETVDGERLDTRATRTTGEANQELETVGAFNGADDGGG
jgi:hypothetical protein